VENNQRLEWAKKIWRLARGNERYYELLSEIPFEYCNSNKNYTDIIDLIETVITADVLSQSEVMKVIIIYYYLL